MPIGVARAVVTKPRARVFLDPGPVTETFDGSASNDNITTNSVTASVGDRVVLCFQHHRGSPSTPSANRLLSTVVGTGDFSALDLTDFTVHQNNEHRDDGNNGGFRQVIASVVIPAGSGGTGAFTISWNNTVWSQLAWAYVLPPCIVVDSTFDTASDADTTAEPALAASPDANDLVISICGQMHSDAFNVPTDFTSEADSSSSVNDRHRGAFKNGAAPQTISWTGLRNDRPSIASAIQLRRT